MAGDDQIHRVLRLYGDDCRGLEIEPLKCDESFSGSSLWRLKTPRGELCLRCFPCEHPTPERLEFIQAVLWHVDQEGFHQIPLPLETTHHHGYVRHAGQLWELSPWLPGVSYFRGGPNPTKLHNALATLASFHLAAKSFPLPEGRPVRSPGIAERKERLTALLSGGADSIRKLVRSTQRTLIANQAERALRLFDVAAPSVLSLLNAAAEVRLPLQPCIRDIWSPHVLFVGDEVSAAIVDFGAMRPDNVATDIARLLGSLALDQPLNWQRGLSAYESVRRLSDDEARMVKVFDHSSVVLAPLQWLHWIYVEQRTFAKPTAMAGRFEEVVARLAWLVENSPNDAPH